MTACDKREIHYCAHGNNTFTQIDQSHHRNRLELQLNNMIFQLILTIWISFEFLPSQFLINLFGILDGQMKYRFIIFFYVFLFLRFFLLINDKLNTAGLLFCCKQHVREPRKPFCRIIDVDWNLKHFFPSDFQFCAPDSFSLFASDKSFGKIVSIWCCNCLNLMQKTL